LLVELVEALLQVEVVEQEVLGLQVDLLHLLQEVIL
jgi:hypothetical protein